MVDTGPRHGVSQSDGAGSGTADNRPWDARLSACLVAPLRNSWVSPNHLTTLRLIVGLAAAVAFANGTYAWSNAGALLLVMSNFLDHADGELARLSGKSSALGHRYDLVSDALVTILLFVAMGAGVGKRSGIALDILPITLGAIAGGAVALIFHLRMRIEALAGKAATRQASFAGFETEDILYLMPLATLCDALQPLLVASAICAPLYAVWMIVGYRRIVRQPRARSPAAGGDEMSADPCLDARPRGAAAPGAAADPDPALAERLTTIDPAPLCRKFIEHGGFVHQQQFLPDEVTARLVAAVAAVQGSVNRNYLPGHKQGGSVSRHTIDALAPFIADLYRSPTLVAWLERLAGERLQLAPAADPHAYALYFYTAPGDHIGWHYDRSYYRGRRYTLLLGVIDDSSCRLDYELHTREPERETVSGSLRLGPGGLAFFDGDKLRHRITPLGLGERRVSLTFEYVTDPRMHAWWRLISNMKDAVAYFGLRQVFRGAPKDRAAGPPESA